jgi:uncharacterized short protein YbdD (DUF466 family)
MTLYRYVEHKKNLKPSQLPIIKTMEDFFRLNIARVKAASLKKIADMRNLQDTH